MSKLYGSTSWRRVLALALVFVMMFSIMGTSGYSVFAEELPETGEEVVVSEPEAVTPEVTVDDQGPSPGEEETELVVEPTTDAEPVEATEEGEEPVEEVAEPAEPTEEAIEDEEVEEPAEAAEEAEESEELELVEDEEIVEEEEDPEEGAVSEDSSEPTLVEEASQIVAEDDGSECEAPEAVAEPSVISDTAQLIMDALAQEGDAALEELPEEPEVFFTETMTKKLERVIVTAIPSEGAFREPVELNVVPIPKGAGDYIEAEAALAESGVEYNGMLVYDISFRSVATGKFIEPEAPVSVSMEITDKALAAVDSDKMDVESLTVTHIGSEVTEAVADVADETAGTVTVSMNEDVVDGISAEFVVDSFSKFVLTWTNEQGDAEANIYWGYMNGDTFVELEKGSTVTLDTTAGTVSLENTYAGYYCIGATYKVNASSDAVDLNQPRLTKTDTGWQITTNTHNDDDTTTVNTVELVDGSEIYVIYGPITDPAPSGGGSEDVPAPKTTKAVTKNTDGTYKIRLEVTGTMVEEIEQVGANVLVVMDRTYSMRSGMGGGRNRWQVSQDAVEALVDALDCETNDIELALVTFFRVGESRTINGETWTNDGTAFVNLVNSIDANSNTQQYGTNWESGLYYARQALNSRDDDATYVIFLTDGEPNRNGTTTYTTVNAATAISSALTQAQAITALNDVSLYGIFCGADSGYNNLANMITNAGGVQTINGTNEDAIKGAFQNIADTIVSNLGANNVAVDDGVPSLSSISSNVAGEPGGYIYYIKPADATEWTKWDGAPGAIYSNDNGVTWDLSSVGVLPEGASYAIEFNVWPSQEAYDLIADLNNGIVDYDDLTDEEQEAVTGSKESGYTLVTNTHLNTTYSFNGTEYSDKPYETVPSAAMPLPTQTIGVEKIWNNFIDQQNPPASMKLVLTKDGKPYLNGANAIEVSKANDWKRDDIYISLGQIKHKDGSYEILETGHDYEIVEPEAYTGDYRWELTSEVYHPMVIDGSATMLIKDDNVTGTEGTDYYIIKGVTYRVADSTNGNRLQAWNDRRSWLQIEKNVTGEGAPGDALFEFTVKINDANKEDVWYSAYGSDGIIKDLETSGTAETGDTGYYYASSGTEITVKLQAGWTLRFLNLPSGTTYEIEETGFPDGFAFDKAAGRYTVDTDVQQDTPNSPDISGKKAEGTINVPNVEFYVDYTNKYEETSVTVTKAWTDGNNRDQIRPTAAEFKENISLLVNGKVSGDYDDNCTVTDNKDNTYTIKYAKLPMYINNTAAEYEVEETTVPSGYSVTGSPADNNGTITNTHTPKTEATVKKVWDDGDNRDGKRPESLFVQLLANNEPEGDPIELNANNRWTATVSNLPVYASGSEIDYTWNETVPEGYSRGTDKVEGTVTTLTNSYTPGKTSVSVVKVWNDADNQDGIRPESVSVQLKANGTAQGDPVVLDDSKKWAYTWENLAKNNNGQAITYTVEEVETDVITGTDGEKTYAYEVTGTMAEGFTITNTHTPAKTEVTVTKTWSDYDNQYNTRPQSIKVQLYADKKEVGEPITIAEGDKWTYTWSELDRYAGGKEITYTVDELEVPNIYTRNIGTPVRLEDGNVTVAITNTYTRSESPSRPPKPPVEEPDEPIDDPETPLAPIEEDPEIDDPETPLAPYEEEPDEEISEEPTPFSPYTGDDRHTAVWGFVSLLSLAGIVVVARKRREE